MKAQFIAAARREFLGQVAYYNNEKPGLGAEFARAVEEAVARALAFPDAGTPAILNTRRVIIKTFPFSVFYRSVLYRPGETGIIVFALAHHARKPGYWKGRVPDAG